MKNRTTLIARVLSGMLLALGLSQASWGGGRVSLNDIATALANIEAAVDDGVVIITQATVDAGTLPGDGPGFPLTITQPGSYRLAGKLQLPDINTTAITSTVEGVHIDLNGFSISGPNDCTGSPNSGTFVCPGGSGDGIVLTGNNSVVHGGSINGVGHFAVQIADNGSVRNMNIRDAGGFAVVATFNARVESNKILDSAGGITTQTGGIVKDNIVGKVGSTGINTTGVVINNVVINCSLIGINAGQGVVVDNHITFCGGFGIDGNTVAARGNNLWNNNDSNDQFSTGVIETGENVCQGSLICP